MFEITTQSVALPDGREITIETGKMARQADGAVVVRLGDAMLLATVVSSKEAKEGVDFLPLSVDYQEKFASAGRIPGSFQRREGRLGDHEILISRLVDRALRPIFPDTYHADTQVMITLISADPEVQPDALAALAASSALAVSNIPFNGPISEVRVAKIDGQYHINPKTSALERATIDLIVAATEKDICMVEGEMDECSEAEVVEALKIAHEAIKVQCQAQKELEAKVGKTEKREFNHETHDEELRAAVRAATYDKIYAAVSQQNPSKKGRSEAAKAIRDEYIASFPEGSDVNVGLDQNLFPRSGMGSVASAGTR